MSRPPLPEPPDGDLNAYLAKTQNTLDHLTAKIYGPGVKFEKLSAIGQYTIESLARQNALISEPDPELRNAKAQIIDLTLENESLNTKLSNLLREFEDLWDENEELRMESLGRETESI